MKHLLLIAVLLIPTSALAQNGGNTINLPQAVTAEESFLAGAARLWVGRGYFLESYGNYLNLRESARQQYIDNWSHRIRTRWAIQDEYKMRNRKENYLDYRERAMENAIRRHALDQKEKELIEKGILPKKQEPGFVIRGKKFKTLEEYYASEEYKLEQRDREHRKVLEAQKEADEAARHKEAVAFARMWDKMGFFEREKYSRLSPEEKARWKAEFQNPELMWKRLEDERNRKFYETRPYLAPQAGKNGLPPLPTK